MDDEVYFKKLFATTIEIQIPLLHYIMYFIKIIFIEYVIFIYTIAIINNNHKHINS